MWVMTPPTRVPAQFRGALVGAFSVVISLAAHGGALHRSHPAGHAHHGPAAAAAPPGAPDAAAIGALLLASWLLGLLVVRTTRRRAGPVALAGLLIAGQVAGHLALSVGAAEAGHPLLPSATMLLWHGAAVLAGVAGILSAEAAAAGAETVRAAVRAALVPPTITAPALCLPVSAADTPARPLHGAGAGGCRAPPLPV